MIPNFGIISGNDIAATIQGKERKIKDVIKSAYELHHSGKSINPDSCFLQLPNSKNRIIALPAHLDSKVAISGIKWIASYPNNISHNIPRASAVLILNDAETGYPLVCMESSIISATRTVASAVLAIEHLNLMSKEINNLGIIGCGLISRYLLKFLLHDNWKIKKIHLYDQTEIEALKYKQDFSKKELDIEIYKNIDDLLAESNIAAFATTASSPYVENISSPSPRIILNLSLRDLSPSIIKNSINIVDDIDHVLKAETSLHLSCNKENKPEFDHFNIVQLFNHPPSPSNKRYIFSPFGLGVLDIALGQYIYKEAITNNLIHYIPSFFHDIYR